jgi:hypothetical protein
MCSGKNNRRVGCGEWGKKTPDFFGINSASPLLVPLMKKLISRTLLKSSEKDISMAFQGDKQRGGDLLADILIL